MCAEERKTFDVVWWYEDPWDATYDQMCWERVVADTADEARQLFLSENPGTSIHCIVETAK